jgi:hypothetical protein
MANVTLSLTFKNAMRGNKPVRFGTLILDMNYKDQLDRERYALLVAAVALPNCNATIVKDKKVKG